MLPIRPRKPGVSPGLRLLFPDLLRWVRSREGRGDFLVAVADRRSLFLAEAFEAAANAVELPVARVAVVGAARWIPDLYRSDHSAFWSRKIPALMLTDSAEFRNEHYHRPTDSMDTLDFDFAARALRASLRALGALAGPDPPADG